MSAIDCIDHSHIGHFCGLNLYHPIDKQLLDNIEPHPRSLIIGGGSGEGNLLVWVKEGAPAVNAYLDFFYSECAKNTDIPNEFKVLQEFKKYAGDDLFWKYNISNNVSYEHEDNKNLSIQKFHAEVTKEFSKFTSQHRHETLRIYSVDDMINIMIGEFIIMSGIDRIHSITKKHRKTFKDAIQHGCLGAIFDAVKIITPGYSVYGRYIHNGCTVWGLSFFDEDKKLEGIKEYEHLFKERSHH